MLHECDREMEELKQIGKDILGQEVQNLPEPLVVGENVLRVQCIVFEALTNQVDGLPVDDVDIAII